MDRIGVFNRQSDFWFWGKRQQKFMLRKVKEWISWSTERVLLWRRFVRFAFTKLNSSLMEF